MGAAALLAEAGIRLNKPRLSNLAVAVRLDAFTKVKQAIDNMVAQLLQEKQDEIKHKDWCNTALHGNQMSQDDAQRNMDEANATVDSLKADISNLDQNVETLTAEVAELKKQVKRAGEDRAKENADFQAVVKDQRATQHLLKKAMNVLQAVYNKKKANLMQKDPVGPPPPSGFKAYEKSSGAQNVINMIQAIANDAKAMEAEAIRDEGDAQAAYESFVKESNRSIDTKNKASVNQSAVRAQKDREKVSQEEAGKGYSENLEQLSEESGTIHSSCDFTLKNFDIRQEARDQEVEALRQAKSILSGSNFNAFLQKFD